MKKCINISIGQTTIEKKPDYDADSSYLGEYGNKLKPGCYIRSHKKFYEDITEEDDIPNLYNRNEFNFFYPPDTGEKIGTEEYKKYALQDYELMGGLNDQQWSYVGIIVKTEIIVKIPAVKKQPGYTEISDTIISSVYGIDDHWDKESNAYIKTIIDELKEEQKDQLLQMGFSEEEINQSFKEAKEVNL